MQQGIYVEAGDVTNLYFILNHLALKEMHILNKYHRIFPLTRILN